MDSQITILKLRDLSGLTNNFFFKLRGWSGLTNTMLKLRDWKGLTIITVLKIRGWSGLTNNRT